MESMKFFGILDFYPRKEEIKKKYESLTIEEVYSDSIIHSVEKIDAVDINSYNKIIPYLDVLEYNFKSKLKRLETPNAFIKIR